MNNDRMILFIFLQLMVIAALIMIDIDSHSISWYKAALFGLLATISVLLLLKRFRFIMNLKSLSIDLRRVMDGHFNIRLLANEDRLFNHVIFSVNELIEQLEKVQVQSIKSQAARRSLLSSISHDIRTPLTSIIGYVDALKDDIAASEEEKQEYIDIVFKKANSLKQLINEIFDMAKLDADEMPIKLEPIDFAEITRETLIEVLPELKNNNMELIMSIPEEVCLIMADHLSMMRIINNLIKNALHYGNEGKVLGIELTETLGEYQLVIWDQGPGIAEAELDHVFERMYRSDQARSPFHGGSGLGLSIAKALVEKNHGRIWVESLPWKKTSFGFSIPKAKFGMN